MPFTTWASADLITAAKLNNDNTIAVATDTARTITVTHSWTAAQTFTGGWTAAAACTITSASATALAVGLAGATNPALLVDASTATSATGLKVKSAAAAGGLALSVITSGTNENLTLDAAAAGTITIAGTSTGAVIIGNATTPAQNVFIGDNSNANATAGLTVNQGPADDEILTLKSSDVAHGMTSQTETDTYGVFKKNSATNGALTIVGYGEDTLGLDLKGRATTGDTTKSIAAVAPLYLQAQKKNGTTVQAMGANENLAVIDNGGGSVRFIFDSDGDSHQDVGTAWTNFDTHDDVALLNLLSAHVTRADDPLRENFGGWLEQNRAELEATRLVTFNKDGHHFVNMSRLSMLLVGALRQVGERVVQLEARLLPGTV